MAYKRRSLQLRGLISGIKKKPFQNEPQQRCSKYVFHLLVFNKALKRHSFNFQLERGGGRAHTRGGLIIGSSISFTGRWAYYRGSLQAEGLISGSLRYIKG